MVFGLSSFTALGENKVTRALITMSYWLSLVATPVSMVGLAETIVVFLKIDPAIAGTCPASGISSSSGAINLNSNCQVAGDINLSGTASLTMTDAVLTVQGNIVLNDQAVLMVTNGGLTIPQTDYFQNWMNLNNNSQMIIKKSSFVTNATSNKSLGMFLKAYDSSVLTFEESTLLTRGSWLITHFYDQAKLTVNNSLNLPTEIYPFDSSQISVSNSEFASLWLDFVPGSIGTVNVPQGDAQGKFDFDFGKSPGFDYSIHISASHARLGLSSHPNSSMTVNGNGASGTNDIGLAFAYGVYNNTGPVTIDGLNVGSDVTRKFSDSGRTLSLNHVNLNPFSWQVYVMQSNGYPVTVTRSKINEVGALANGLVNVSNSVLQLAVLEAEGPGSRVQRFGHAHLVSSHYSPKWWPGKHHQ